jgi:hypothetical protein
MAGLPYTKEQLSFLKKKYKTNSLKELTALFNQKFVQTRTTGSIKGILQRNNFTSGRTGRFQQNGKPWNKGTKGCCIPNKTSFKKGNVPHNAKPLYSERIRKNGYIEISVPEKNRHTGYPSRYIHKHVWIWKQANGQVPDGYVVSFLDGDITNIVLENLTLLSREELLWLNKNEYAKYEDPEIRKTMRLMARVICAAYKKNKEKT